MLVKGATDVLIWNRFVKFFLYSRVDLFKYYKPNSLYFPEYYQFKTEQRLCGGRIFSCLDIYKSLLWLHNGCNGVSNHQPYDCLLNRWSRRRSKTASKLRVICLCAGNHKWPVARNMFPFHDVIMCIKRHSFVRQTFVTSDPRIHPSQWEWRCFIEFMW